MNRRSFLKGVGAGLVAAALAIPVSLFSHRTPPRHKGPRLVDPRTGRLEPQWFRYFQEMSERLGGPK